MVSGWSLLGRPPERASCPGLHTTRRFVRTAFQKLHMVQPETMQEAVIAGFHILEGVTLPNGVVKTANGTFDYTSTLP